MPMRFQFVKPIIASSLCLLGSMAVAQELTFDAFGVYQGLDQMRDHWAGQRKICTKASCDNSDVQIIQAHDVDELSQFFGQKSITAGQEKAMSLSVATDQYGNLVKEGTVNATIQNGAVVQSASLKDGIAIVEFQADTRAHQDLASVYTSNLQSLNEFYRIIPDTLSIDPQSVLVKSESRQGNILRLETEPLFDRSGNEAPLGFYMSAILRDQAQRYSFAPLVMQSQKAEIHMITDSLAGPYQIELSANQKHGASTQFVITPTKITAIENIQTRLYQDTNILQVRLASIMTDQNHLIKDATRLELDLVEADGTQHVQYLWTVDGAVETHFSIQDNAFPLVLLVKQGAQIMRLEFSALDVETAQ